MQPQMKPQAEEPWVLDLVVIILIVVLTVLALLQR